MEAIVNVISNYALSDAQSDSVNNVSLTPFYRKMEIHVSNTKTFKVMSLDHPETGTTLKAWSRLSLHVEDFSREGKIALDHLREQIHIRLPDVSSEQGAVVILDPMTKIFAHSILGTEKYGSSKNILLHLHCTAYNVLHAPDKSTFQETIIAPTDSNMLVDAFDVERTATEETREDLPFNIFASATVNMEIADSILENYLLHTIEFNKFLVPGADRFSEKKLCHLKNVSAIKRFDSMKFFAEYGQLHFPSICLLARSLMARFSNAGFQDRFFSVARLAMRTNQCCMSFDHLEKRTILARNKKLCQDGIIKGVFYGH